MARRRRPLRRLLAGLLLPVGATSLTGIGALAAYHAGKTKSVAEVPGLAQALAKPTKVITPTFHQVVTPTPKTPTTPTPTVPVHTPIGTPVHVVTQVPQPTPVQVQPVPVTTTTTLPPKKVLPVDLSLVAGSGATSLIAPLNDMVPGDVVEREVELSNTGQAPIASVTISASPTSSVSLLTAAQGLELEIRRCAGTWSVGASSDGGEAYVCSGQESSTNPIVVGNLATTPIVLTGLAVDSPGATSHLVFWFSLPSGAGNAEANQQGGISWTFEAEGAATGS
jgi:hypothetical protein